MNQNQKHCNNIRKGIILNSTLKHKEHEQKL